MIPTTKRGLGLYQACICILLRLFERWNRDSWSKYRKWLTIIPIACETVGRSLWETNIFRNHLSQSASSTLIEAYYDVSCLDSQMVHVHPALGVFNVAIHLQWLVHTRTYYTWGTV
jgi:hypothetical protein